MLIVYYIKVVGIPLNLTRVELPSLSSNTPLFTISCCQVTGAEKYSNTHYSNYTAFPSKVLSIETSLTCNSFKFFSWTSVLAKESELVSRVSFDFPESV